MDNQQSIELTRQELKDVIREAVDEAFTKMGIDTTNPIEMQADFKHLREWRLSMVAMRTKGMLAIMTIVVSGAAAALWVGFKATLTQGP